MLQVLANEMPDPVEHVMPHQLLPNGPFWFTNQIMMAAVAAVLMMLIFPFLFRKAQTDAPSGARNFFESILEYLRVEVFRPALKEHTERFLPFLWTLFFFILFCNVLGSIPFGAVLGLVSGGKLAHWGGTATGTLSATGGLAICAFLGIHVSGVLQVFKSLRDGTYGHHASHEEHSSNGGPGHEAAHDLEHGRGEGLAADVPQDLGALTNPTQHYGDDEHPSHEAHGHGAEAHGADDPLILAALKSPFLYLWNFAPHPFKPQPGQSAVMWIPDIGMWGALLILEIIGAAIKPFALSVRLFANMVGGHLVVAAMFGLIVLAPSVLGQIGVSIPMGLMILGISVMELFVALLQAYIFTFLTTLFIASAVAPEH